MYYMSESEFMQYEMAEMRFADICRCHAIELQQAYDGIHPTRSCFDYGLGKIYSESVNPAEYAIYLIELKEEHERIEKWWELRAEAFKKARKQLTDEECMHLDSREYNNIAKREKVRKRLRDILKEIISTRPELQRQAIPVDPIEDMEEADRRIDKMSMDELLEDYWDKENLPNGTGPSKT